MAVAADVTHPASGSAGFRSPSRWLARLTFATPELIAVAIAGCAPGPIVLLLAGQFRIWLAIVLAVFGAATALACFRLPDGEVTGRGVGTTVIAAVMVVAWFALNVVRSGEDLYAQRDPSIYQLTARWLMDHKSLPIPTHPEVFGSLPGLDDTSAGFLANSPGFVYAQGNHLLPVILAAVGTLLGPAVMLKANAAITALALFVFFGAARRVVGGGCALIAMSALAVCMPLLYVGRDTYSEPLALLLLMGALSLLHRALPSGRPIDFALAGLVASGAAVVRIDSYLALLTLIVVALVLAAAAATPPERRVALRRGGALLLGAAPVAVLGYLDVTRLAGGYYHNQRVQIVPLMIAAGVLLVLGAGFVASAWRIDLAQRLRTVSARRLMARWAVGGLFLVFAILSSRPLWLTVHGNVDNQIVRAVQQAAGDTVDGTRLYAEQSVTWQAMYVGWVTVGLALVGYALLLRALILRSGLPLLPILTMGLTVSALYLWTPQITPDQIWAMRRYVPVVLPLLLVAATYAVRRTADWCRRRPEARAPWPAVFGIGAIVGGAVLIIGVPAAVSRPIADLREQVPQLQQVQALCRAVRGPTAVIAVDDGLRYGYSQTIRSWCGVPTLGLVGATPAQLSAARDAAERAGRTLYAIAATPDQLHLTGTAPERPFSSVTVSRWPSTLHSPPQSAVEQTIAIYLGTVEPDGRVTAVPPP